MYISTEKLYLIVCCIAFFVSGLLTKLITLIFSINYTTTLITTFFILIILVGVILILLNNKEWYKELTDYSFYKFKKVYDLYRIEVIEKKVTYQRFVDDYIAENRLISYSLDSQGNPIVSEYNMKNKILNQIIGLLNDRKDLVEKYFILEDFKYSSYLNLIKEYNTTEIEKQEEHKDETCLKMQVINFITTSRKTKGTQTLGDRLFGYYLKSKGLTSLTLSQCKEEWNKLIKEHNPIDNCRYIKTPDDFRQESEIPATIDNLQKIEEFFIINDELRIIEVIKRDIKNLQELLK